MNAERFITADLKEYESRVLGAEEARIKREVELFQELRRRLAGEAPRLKKVARALGVLDVLAALAEVAAAAPVLPPPPGGRSRCWTSRPGRHPVIERLLPPGGFVPNDVALDPESQVLIVTGPNM